MTLMIADCEQRSEAWRLARVGRLTGTAAKDMLATIKSGEAAARRDLRMRLVCERLTGQPQDDTFVNAAMQRGIDKEPDAIAAYEAKTGDLLLRSGFIIHPELMAGCSLDGHVGDYAGLVELKCPKSATHFGYLRAGSVPAEHLAQITHNLWITGAAWCDFFSFDDRFPLALQTFLVRVRREDVDVAGYEAKARAFLQEVDIEYRAALGWRVLEDNTDERAESGRSGRLVGEDGAQGGVSDGDDRRDGGGLFPGQERQPEGADVAGDEVETTRGRGRLSRRRSE